MRNTGWIVTAAVLAWLGLPAAARAQEDRRGRTEPGLIVETGARMGACDALQFSADGQQLLAVGDDKVIRLWPFAANGLDTANARVLRWATWREQRGAIYALAQSPPNGYPWAAIGGYGVRNGAVVVLNRITGEVVHALTDVKGNDQTIWALAFAPSSLQLAVGTADGSVWLWDLGTGKKNDFRKLGPASNAAGRNNRVRLLAYLNATQILSVTQDGQVLRWDARRGDATAVRKLQTAPISAAALSPDQRLLAVAGEKSVVELATLDDKAARTVPLPADNYPNCVAFDSKSERLAVGIRVVDPKASFRKDLDGSVVVYDLKQTPPQALPGLRTDEYAEALAFHPDGKVLAIAGGPNNEVKLHRLEGARVAGPVGASIRSPGSCLFGVAFSKDGQQVGFQNGKAADPAHPNRRGTGAWEVFHLMKRQWGTGANFQPVAPLETLGGWQVRFSTAQVKDAFIWYALGPDQKLHELPLDRTRDGMPRCYTFLNPKTPGQPVRLAVGHYWGISVFELTAKGARRVRLFTGHQGEVLALAPSADHKLLVSASRDQTIAGWSLADWPSEAELGAAFKVQGGKMVVSAVDAGSPAWEAGLAPDDELTFLAFAGKPVEGGADKWHLQLRNTVPARELYFRLRRAGVAQPFDLLTTVRQRPLWRFFPTREREWVLWRYRDYYYDTSTNGDYYIGWQVSGDVDREPVFYRAEQFRQRFHQPRKLAEALAGMVKDPDRAALVAAEPPEVKMEVSALEVNDEPIIVTFKVMPRGNSAEQQINQVILWVNDYQLRSWQPADGPFEQKAVVPANKLRSGSNLLTLQCYGKAGGRGEIYPPVTIQNKRPEPPIGLFGICAGVGNYRKIGFPNLNANRDVEVLRQSWIRQKAVLYKEVDIQLLVDDQVTRQAILDNLEKLTGRVQPDDVFLLVLAGHGASAEVVASALKQSKLTALESLAEDDFVYCPSDFDVRRPLSTGITSKELYKVVARLPCRKIILLDACRSGTMVVSPVRQMTHDGVGPIIFAASQPGEDAQEDQGESTAAGTVYGLFSRQVVQAMGDQFDKADTNKDSRLMPQELYDFVRPRIAILGQNPAMFLPTMERQTVLARKK